MPVSSLGDKLIGFAVIALLLVGGGFAMEYSFSPASPLLNEPGPKVDYTAQKYSAQE